MQVGLKIWRYDSKTGDRALREYEVDAPEEATLLDTPISWLTARDVIEGRQHLNFSTWGQPTGRRGEGANVRELVRSVQNGSMPPAIYLPLHPAARLTAEEQQQLIAGFTATFQ